MRYGLPYKGSKNGIAEWIVSQLPSADVFVDLFFGGGAVTHRAMLTGKYKRFIVNDIDARLPKLFLDCAYGKYTVDNHPEWITRQEFNKRKHEDAYIALVWSFGNNGKDYLYGADIEDMKHAYHKAVYEDDTDALRPYGYVLTKCDKKGVYERYLDYQRQIKKQTPGIQLEIVTRQTEIERLQSLQSLQSFGRDYREVPIGGAVKPLFTAIFRTCVLTAASIKASITRGFINGLGNRKIFSFPSIQCPMIL